MVSLAHTWDTALSKLTSLEQRTDGTIPSREEAMMADLENPGFQGRKDMIKKRDGYTFLEVVTWGG